MSAVSAIAQAQAFAAAAEAANKGRIKTADSKSGDKKKKKGRKKKAPAIPRDMVLGPNGELVPAREYALEQTLEATSKSLTQYRERMAGLVNANEDLQETCQQQEKDALDVIAALHRENEKRENQIKELRQQIEEEAELAREDRETMVDDYERKIAEMNTQLTEKEAAFHVMQQEFSVIKDFRKKRHDLMKELEQQKIQMSDMEKRHKETVARMERKFFEEKIRLQKEANRKISELATKAHKEAVANLTETTKEVFRQNVRMAEALRYHVQEGEELGKTNTQLTQVNKQLLEEKDLHDVIVKEKILQTKQQSQEIKDLHSQIQNMEHALSHVVREFEHERDIIGRMAKRELDEVRKVAGQLKESLDRKTREMRQIKRLAQHILDQRTDLERFFMDALDHVRGEIQKEREAAKKAAQAEYNRRMRAILANKGTALPEVQSGKSTTANGAPGAIIMPDATGKEMAAAAPGGDPNTKVDISDLAWSDKEKVLRLLFARMNGVSLVGKGGGEYAEAADDASQEGKSDAGSSYAFRSAFEGREVNIDDEDEGRWDPQGGHGVIHDRRDRHSGELASQVDEREQAHPTTFHETTPLITVGP